MIQQFVASDYSYLARCRLCFVKLAISSAHHQWVSSPRGRPMRIHFTPQSNICLLSCIACLLLFRRRSIFFFRAFQLSYLSRLLMTNFKLLLAILDSSEAALALQTLHQCLPFGFLLFLFCNHIENSD